MRTRHSHAIKLVFAAALALLVIFAAACGEKPEEPVDVDASVTEAITSAPTAIPTEAPTEAPTAEPTEAPTEEPTAEPTEAPTEEPTAQPANTPKPTQAANPSQSGRKVYLTFDDGPTDRTPKVLDILKQYNAKATFFTVGYMVNNNPKTAKRIVDEGHLLACHTQSHDLKKIYKSTEALINDINAWRATVKKAVGYDAGAYVMRFPGGTTNTTIGGRNGRSPYVKAVNKAGYKVFDWNIGLNDAWLAGNTKNLPIIDYLWESYTTTYAMYKNKDPLILIIHDTRAESVKLLPRVLEDLIAKGFEFGLVSELDDNYLM
ncbi:MAG: polysaccharide deacetylase family protein [Clostridia bacterium]|nr:polysaccharide deacetylase family protein [Clostridia bacterium]